MVTNTTDVEDHAANGDERDDSGSTTGSGVTRRRTLQMGGLLGAGSLFGVTGFGTDTAAACDRLDTIVRLDYDDYDSWDEIYRRSNGDPDNMTFVSSPTATGDTALQLRIEEGDNWGVSTHYDFEDGLFELLGRVRFALNSNWSMEGRSLANCRLWNCALARGPGSAGGGDTDGTNGWSNRLYVTNRGSDPDGPFYLLSNTYHMGHPGWGDQDYIMDDEQYALGAPEIEPGVWYEFGYYVRVNTTTNGQANADGVVRYWLDNERVYERENFRFTEDHDNNVIDTNGPAGHYGGQYSAPRNLYAYYDDHAMVYDDEYRYDSC